MKTQNAVNRVYPGLIGGAIVFVLCTGVYVVAQRNQRLGTSASVEDFDFDSLLAAGTPRSNVLQRLGGPRRGFRLVAVGRYQNEHSYKWRFDDGSDAEALISRHLPSQFHPSRSRYSTRTDFSDQEAVGAWEWDGCLVFFNHRDEVVFWCPMGRETTTPSAEY